VKHLDIANDNHKRLAHELLKDDFEAAIHLNAWEHLPTVAQVCTMGINRRSAKLKETGICTATGSATIRDHRRHDDSEFPRGAISG